MFKINFNKSELPKSELSYENLKILSKTHDLMLIMNGISGWFRTIQTNNRFRSLG